MKSRIFSTTWAGSKIFTLLPKVEIHAKKVGLISTGTVMVKCSSSTGIIITSLPNWSITASASSLRKRMRTLYSLPPYISNTFAFWLMMFFSLKSSFPFNDFCIVNPLRTWIRMNFSERIRLISSSFSAVSRSSTALSKMSGLTF